MPPAGPTLGLGRGLGLGLALAMTAAGCERVTRVLEDEAQEVAQELSSADVDPAELTTRSRAQLIDDKLTLIRQCTDRASPRIRESWRRYQERLDDDGTPRSKDLAPVIYAIDSELAPCESAALRCPTKEPPMPEIELALRAYLEHGRRFAAHTVALDAYYDTAAYAEDDWATGKRIAPELASAYEAWRRVDVELQRRIDTEQDVVERARLAEVQQRTGQGVEWHARRVMLDARTLQRCVGIEPASGDEPPSTPVAVDCADAFADLRRSHEAFVRHLDEHPDDADAVFWMSAYRASTTDYVEEVASHLEAPGSGELPPEVRDDMLASYVRVRTDRNNLRFSR